MADWRVWEIIEPDKCDEVRAYGYNVHERAVVVHTGSEAECARIARQSTIDAAEENLPARYEALECPLEPAPPRSVPSVSGYRPSPALADGFRQYARNGRAGTCAACPRTADGQAFPEFCEHTDRYDHQQDLARLVFSDNWERKHPESNPAGA